MLCERDPWAGATWLGLAQQGWNSALLGANPEDSGSECHDPEAPSDFFVRGDFAALPSAANDLPAPVAEFGDGASFEPGVGLGDLAPLDSAPKDPELAPGEFGEGAVSEPMAVLGDFVDLVKPLNKNKLASAAVAVAAVVVAVAGVVAGV